MSNDPTTEPTPSASLQRRRDELAEQVAGLQFDLGGLTYEMAVRDHFRLDVLVRRAALMQTADAELAEIDRLLAETETGVTGSCPECSAPHSRGALFCWQCGTALVHQTPVEETSGIAGPLPAKDDP